MTIQQLKELYPACVEQLQREAYTAGQQTEQEQWQKRLLSEKETGKFLDDLIREAFADDV